MMNPGAESSSAGKTQAEAAANARAVMDAKYVSMAAKGSALVFGVSVKD